MGTLYVPWGAVPYRGLCPMGSCALWGPCVSHGGRVPRHPPAVTDTAAQPAVINPASPPKAGPGNLFPISKPCRRSSSVPDPISRSLLKRCSASPLAAK